MKFINCKDFYMGGGEGGGLFVCLYMETFCGEFSD